MAQHGYDAILAGKLVTVNDSKFSFMVNWLTSFLPRHMVLKMTDKTQSK